MSTLFLQTVIGLVDGNWADVLEAIKYAEHFNWTPMSPSHDLLGEFSKTLNFHARLFRWKSFATWPGTQLCSEYLMVSLDSQKKLHLLDEVYLSLIRKLQGT